MSMILSRIANAVPFSNASRFNAYAKAVVRNAPHDEVKRVEGILSFVHTKGGSDFALQIYKMLSLSQLCRELQPKTILEIGSGASTPIFASYAANNNASIISIEEHQEWLATSQELVKRFGDSGAVQFQISKTAWTMDGESPEVRYCDVPKQDYDLIFVDGPTLQNNGTDLKKTAICMDALDFAAEGYVKHIVVDMRLPTVRALEKRLTASWSKGISDVLTRNPRERFDYYSVFSKQ